LFEDGYDEQEEIEKHHPGDFFIGGVIDNPDSTHECAGSASIFHLPKIEANNSSEEGFIQSNASNFTSFFNWVKFHKNS
jgi:hypothetical protein